MEDDLVLSDRLVELTDGCSCRFASFLRHFVEQ